MVIGIFIALNHYTTFIFLKAVKKLSADVVVKYMRQELFHTYGVPETVFSDNETQFKGEIFRKKMKALIMCVLERYHIERVKRSSGETSSKIISL